MFSNKIHTTLGALAASAAFAAALAGPVAAHADTKTTGGTPKKECKLGTPDPGGAQTYVKDGTVITKKHEDGSSYQLECKDGTWGSPSRIAAGSTGAIVAVGALQLSPETSTSPTYSAATTPTRQLAAQ
jgi:hypothetical protein